MFDSELELRLIAWNEEIKWWWDDEGKADPLKKVK